MPTHVISHERAVYSYWVSRVLGAEVSGDKTEFQISQGMDSSAEIDTSLNDGLELRCHVT
jgi:hypothetical protein